MGTVRENDLRICLWPRTFPNKTESQPCKLNEFHTRNRVPNHFSRARVREQEGWMKNKSVKESFSVNIIGVKLCVARVAQTQERTEI